MKGGAEMTVAQAEPVVQEWGGGEERGVEKVG